MLVSNHLQLSIFPQEPNTTTDVLDEYLVSVALGGGSCREMVCDPKHRKMRFLPNSKYVPKITLFI